MTRKDKEELARQLFGRMIYMSEHKVCEDLDEDCFIMSAEEIERCQKIDRCKGCCPL